MGSGRMHVSGKALACVGGSACALPGGFARVVGGMCGGWGCRLRLGPLRGTAGGRRDRRPNGPVATRPAPRTPCGSRGPGCRSRLGDATTPAPTAGPGFGPARPAPCRRSRGNTPPRRPHGAPDLSGSATIAENTPSRCPGTPKGDAGATKRTDNAARPISRVACRPLRRDRPSGSDAHRSPANPMRRSGYPTPKLESHINTHENPIRIIMGIVAVRRTDLPFGRVGAVSRICD